MAALVPTSPRTALTPGERIAVLGAGPTARDAAQILETDGWRVVLGPSPTEGQAADELTGASVVVLDASSLDRLDAAEALDLIARGCPQAAVLVMARPGANWPDLAGIAPPRPRVIAVPVHREALLSGLDSALVYRNLIHENRILRQELRAAARLGAWVGCSAEAAAVRSAITTAAFGDGPVSIVGEPGTGRRLAAELVHRLSRRASEAFVPLAVAGLPPGELGTVLAALRRAAGEAGSVREAPDQSPILRGRPGSVYVSGTDRLAPVDQTILRDALRRPLPFRILVSRDPQAGPERTGPGRGTVRSRERGFTIPIAPLRARREDIPALTLHFLSAACREAGMGPWGVSGTTIEAYTAYDWPGNTAELRMWVERAVATAAVSRFDGAVLPDEIATPPDSPLPVPQGTEAKPLREVLAGIERTLIERALRRVGGHQKNAARLLQVNPTTLHEKMKRHGLLRRPKRRAGSGR